MWSGGLFFFFHPEFIKNWIFDLQNREILSVQQKSCSAYEAAFLRKKHPTNRTTTLLSPHTHIPQSDYNHWAVFLYALWLLYLTDQSFGGWKGKLWVYKDKYVMKALIIFHEALNATKPAWWSLRDGLFKLPDWWADYRMIWNILLTRMIFHHFSQSG